nr:MAG TPA: hypothetical protein [Caudoviricetes sp.]
MKDVTIRVRADKLVHPEPHLVKSSAYIANQFCG